jgi:hypothetical protein
LLRVACVKFIHVLQDLWEGQKIKLHSFFTLALDVSELSASCRSCLSSEVANGIHWIGGRVGSKADHYVLALFLNTPNRCSSLRARNKVPLLFITTDTTVYCNLRFLRRRKEDVYSPHNGGKHSPKWTCSLCLTLLGCSITSVGDCCPTFRDDHVVSYLREEISAVNCIMSTNLSCYFHKERRGRVFGNPVSYSGVLGFKSEVLYGLS